MRVQAEHLSRLWKVFDLLRKRLGISISDRYLVTMFDKRLKICREVEVELRRVLGEKVLKTVIPRNSRLAEAPSHGKKN